MKKNNIKQLVNYLDEILPNAYCELNYNKAYELLIAVILSSQTTDKKVNNVTNILFSKYPSLEQLNKANIDDIYNIIKLLGMGQKKALYIKEATHKLLTEYNGIIPNNRALLEQFNGVGRKVANVVLSVLYNVSTIAVDTHVRRIAIRLNIADKKDSNYQIENKLMKLISKDKWSKTHHQLVLFGRYYCTAKKPLCDQCLLNNICKKDIL
jgi:endonuclease III